MSSRARATLIPFVLVTAAAAADTNAGLPKSSPFQERGSAAAPTATANESIEFAGVSTVGKRTDLIFYNKTTKKSHWIAKGETKDGISVVNYDERREQAVVKINGAEKTLSLRKGAGPTSSPKNAPPLPATVGLANPATPIPAADTMQKLGPALPDPANVPPPQTVVAAPNQPAASNQPAAPATPEAQAQQKAETEARMLVSDLLEIGMAQRKAYEEAQRKAAETNKQSAPTSETKQ